MRIVDVMDNIDPVVFGITMHARLGRFSKDELYAIRTVGSCFESDDVRRSTVSPLAGGYGEM